MPRLPAKSLGQNIGMLMGLDIQVMLTMTLPKDHHMAGRISAHPLAEFSHTRRGKSAVRRSEGGAPCDNICRWQPTTLHERGPMVILPPASTAIILSADCYESCHSILFCEGDSNRASTT